MDVFSRMLTALGLLVIWAAFEQAHANPPGRNHLRIERQVNFGGSARPPPAPGPSGYVYKVPNCNCQAPTQFNPVCGSNGVTYVNRQILQCAATCGEKVSVSRIGTCGRGLSTVIERPSTNR